MPPGIRGSIYSVRLDCEGTFNIFLIFTPASHTVFRKVAPHHHHWHGFSPRTSKEFPTLDQVINCAIHLIELGRECRRLVSLRDRAGSWRGRINQHLLFARDLALCWAIGSNAGYLIGTVGRAVPTTLDEQGLASPAAHSTQTTWFFTRPGEIRCSNGRDDVREILPKKKNRDSKIDTEKENQS